MYPTRLWPTVAPVIRGFVGGRSELIYSVKTYGNSPVTQANQPWNLSVFSSTQQSRHQTNFPSSLLGITGSALDITKRIGLQSFSVPFTTTPVNLIQDFQHNENDHAHDVMRSLPAYTSTTYDIDCIEDVLPPIDTINSPPPLPNIDWTLVSPQGIAGSFIALSRECKRRPMDLSSTEHKTIVTALSMSVPKLTDDQLRDVLASLTLWPPVTHPNAPNFIDIWFAIDKESVWRVKKWNLQQSFVMADLWYSLKLSRIGSYTRTMLSTLGMAIESMKPHEIVQYLFHVNLCREPPANVSNQSLEKCIAKIIDKLSLEELGVIAMGLFKTQSFIKTDTLADAFFNKMISSDFSGVSSISIGCMLKLLRKSAQTSRVDKVCFYEFQFYQNIN